VDTISLVIGGSAAITAVAAARLGLSVALVAAVGADPAGTFMLDQLSGEGVDVSAVVIRDETATGVTVALSRGGDRAILGAGDCFNAGLIAGLLQGLPLPEAAALGCAAGALSTGAPGGMASAPDLPAAARLAALATIN
jgi:ribokinase